MEERVTDGAIGFNRTLLRRNRKSQWTESLGVFRFFELPKRRSFSAAPSISSAQCVNDCSGKAQNPMPKTPPIKTLFSRLCSFALIPIAGPETPRSAFNASITPVNLSPPQIHANSGHTAPRRIFAEYRGASAFVASGVFYSP
jgi:hypothetical protein